MRHKISKIFLSGVMAMSFASCANFLDREPSNILTNEQVFSDPNMIKSVLSNFYARIDWGQRITDAGAYSLLDEACHSSGGPANDNGFGDGQWRVYDYDLIRNINQYLVGVRANTTMSETDRLAAEGEARFIRAWTYFNMAKCLGGMPIVGDNVYGYEAGMDVATMRVPRSTEAQIYDYIIKECTEISANLPTAKSINAARATKWAALMLKARAAIYAGSIANYNNKMAVPIVTAGHEVGIPVDSAQAYYKIAYETAVSVIDGKQYILQDQLKNDKGLNFYNATSVKDNNTEVIWARDYKYPGDTHGFTTANIPVSVAEDIDRSDITPVLNIVEAFEYTDNRDGSLKLTDDNGEYIFYDNVTDVFKKKDARLWGSIIYPGAKFRGVNIPLQAGRKYKSNGVWKIEAGQPGSVDPKTGETITALNGPTSGSEQYMNKSGFFFRKFLDETPQSATRGRGSDMWFPRFRIAEAYLIAAEAAMELNDQTNAKNYINKVRARAGIQELTEDITKADIMQENRVEFAFENHRYWDLKRWREADKVWTGVAGDKDATLYELFPYVVNIPADPAKGTLADPNHGKWVFDKNVEPMAKYPRYFQMRNYYNFIDQGWIDNNPLYVKNPYQ